MSDLAAGFGTAAALDTIGRQCGAAHLPPFRLAPYTLYLFPGRNKPAKWLVTPAASHFFTGTSFLPGRPLHELSQPGLRRNDTDGIFFLLGHDGGGLRFTTDRGGLYSVYHSADGTVLSSSFLGLCSGLPSLTPDREALTENLLSGTLIGPSTVFREIKRFEPHEPFLFRGLTYSPLTPRPTAPPPAGGRRQSISHQLGLLNDWFAALRQTTGEAAISTGITGGLDSRLLLALCCRHYSHHNISAYSHMRTVPDSDFRYGREVCNIAGIHFRAVPVTDVFLAGDSLQRTAMEEGMLFNDGQIRTHAFWFEGFNTAAYADTVMGNAAMGFNGIGGEQYRNTGHQLLPRRSMYHWVYDELLSRFSGTGTAGRKTMTAVAERMTAAISARLGVPDSRPVSLMTVKRYMNEIYNPANRALRACHENRRAPFLSPFALWPLSSAAYSALPHLGASLNYEARMIALTDRAMASAGSGYGFPFTRHVPLRRSLPAVLHSNFLPAALDRVLRKATGAGTTGRWTALCSAGAVFGEAASTLGSLALPVDIPGLLTRTDTGPLVFAAGYLIRSLHHKISFL